MSDYLVPFCMIHANLTFRSKSSIHTGRNPIRIPQTPQRGRLSWTMSRPLRLHTLIPLLAFFGNLHHPKSSRLICSQPQAIICGCGHFRIPHPCRAPTQSPGPPIQETPPLLSSLHWRFYPILNLLSILLPSPRSTGTLSPRVLSLRRALTQLAQFGISRP